MDILFNGHISNGYYSYTLFSYRGSEKVLFLLENFQNFQNFGEKRPHDEPDKDVTD